MSTILTRKALEALVEGARIADDEGDILRKRDGQWHFESSAFSQAPISEDAVMGWSPKLISAGPAEPEPAAPAPLTERQAVKAYSDELQEFGYTGGELPEPAQRLPQGLQGGAGMSTFPAKYGGTCHDDQCGARIHPGDEVLYAEEGLVHAECPTSLAGFGLQPGEVVCTECFMVKPCDCDEED